VLSRIADKNTAGRTGCKFVSGCGVQIGVAKATKNTQVVVLRMRAVETKVTGLMTNSAGRTDVEKVAAGAKLTCSRQSVCVVNNQPVGNPKRKV
jgi:hypothetical protein